MEYIEKDYQVSRIEDDIAVFYFTLVEITVNDLKQAKEND